MHEILHSLSHLVGACGEIHPDLLDLLPFWNSIQQSINIQRLPLRLKYLAY